MAQEFFAPLDRPITPSQIEEARRKAHRLRSCAFHAMLAALGRWMKSHLWHANDTLTRKAPEAVAMKLGTPYHASPCT